MHDEISVEVDDMEGLSQDTGASTSDPGGSNISSPTKRIHRGQETGSPYRSPAQRVIKLWISSFNGE